MRNNNRLSREELLEEIFFLLKKIDQDKGHISKPFADIFALTILPLMIYFSLNKTGAVNYFTQYYENDFRKQIVETLSSDPGWELKRKIHALKSTAIQKFEEQLISNAKILIKNSNKLKNYLGINDIENHEAWPFPSLLSELPRIGDKHLLFSLARYADEMGLPRLKASFVEFMNIVIFIGTRFSDMVSVNFSEQIPELTNREIVEDTFEPSELTTQRAAEIFRTLYPDFANFNVYYEQKIDRNAKELTIQYAQYLEYFVTIALSMLTKDFIAAPIIKKLFPVNFYLKNKVDFKANYSLLNAESLAEIVDDLENAHRELFPYAKRNQTISYVINGIIISYGLYLLFKGIKEGRFYFFTIATCIPFVLGMMGGTLLNVGNQWYNAHYAKSSVASLQENLRKIFGEISNAIYFKESLKGTVALSSLKLIVNKPYQGLSKLIVGDIIEQALNRFGVEFLPSYSRTEFAVSAQANIKKSKMAQDFIKDALERAVSIQKLKMQLTKLFELLSQKQIYIYKDISTDAKGLLNCEYSLVFTDQLKSLETVLKKYGFEAKDNFAYLRKNEPYPEQDFDALVQDVKEFFKSSQMSSDYSYVDPSQGVITNRKKGKSAAIPPAIESIIQNNNQNKSVSWPCGAKYPSDNVKPVRGAVNQYIFWNLTNADFGEYKKDYNEFKAKSEQKASRALGKAGIKKRPTLGTYMNKQRLFPAHVKVPGDEFGDRGVLLDVEQAATSVKETLYIARAFEPSIHKGIK